MGQNTVSQFDEAARKKVIEFIEAYKGTKGALIPVLHEVQEHFGYIPYEAQTLIAEGLDVPASEVYGVVTFYSFFSLKPNGKYVIGCCLGTACYVKGAQQIVDKFSEILGIKPGETTEDGLFTIDALRCIGACAIAPAVTINGKVYPHVEISEVQGIVDEYKAKEAAEA